MTTPKPHPDYPLTPRADGRWCKRIRGRLFYFTGTAQEALDEYLRVKDDLLAGRKPRPKGDYLSVGELCNRFLTWKTSLKDSGEIAPRTFDRLKGATDGIVAHFGKTRAVDDLRPEDFEELRAKMAKRWGAVVLGNEVGMVRQVFKYAGGILNRPMNLGQAFVKPSAKVIRQKRAEAGPRMFTAPQIRALLKAASVNVRAMILLGINGGMGNTDLGKLPLTVASGEWLDYPRVKTGIPRRVPLWPETVKAIRAVIKARRQPAASGDAGLLFIGARGESYAGSHKGYRVAQEFDHAAEKAKVDGRSFYDLRRTFQTIAEGAHDLAAVQSIMGHAPASGDMSAIYRQRIDDSRLLAVTNHVREWLYSAHKETPRST